MGAKNVSWPQSQSTGDDTNELRDIDVVALKLCVDVFRSVRSLPEDKNELKTMETLNDLLLRTENEGETAWSWRLVVTRTF